MQISEFAILYISIGVAFGTHKFLSTFRQMPNWFFSCVIATLVWPVTFVFALKKIHSVGLINIIFAKNMVSDSSFEKSLATKQKLLEVSLKPGSGTIPLFLWREVVARYTGLSTALQVGGENAEFELTHLGDSDAHENQQICLARRNRNRLRQHQNSAREDFLTLFRTLASNSSKPNEAVDAALSLINQLNDEIALDRIERFPKTLQQTGQEFSVKNMENGSWIPQEQ
jgi:hypothetical protein